MADGRRGCGTGGDVRAVVADGGGVGGSGRDAIEDDEAIDEDDISVSEEVSDEAVEYIDLS